VATIRVTVWQATHLRNSSVPRLPSTGSAAAVRSWATTRPSAPLDSAAHMLTARALPYKPTESGPLSLAVRRKAVVGARNWAGGVAG
jgi:hypothetical protein